MYGLIERLFLELQAIFLITLLAQYWQIQVLGGLYIYYIWQEIILKNSLITENN